MQRRNLIKAFVNSHAYRALPLREEFRSDALRVLDDVTAERLEVLRAADACFTEEIGADGFDKRLWQYYALLVRSPDCPLCHTVCLRALQEAQGGAYAARLPFDVLERSSERILTQVHGISRVVYDLTPDQVSPDQRRNAKTINFGLIYGMGAQKLAQELKISSNEAKEFIARYFERLTGLKEFYEEVEAVAKRQGYVSTLGGRRRLLPDIHSANGQNYALARRQAINTVIQGSAADIIKLAMLAVAHDAELKSMEARLLLQVHDELLLEVPIDAAAAAGERVAALMSGVMPGGAALSVPLVVDWGQGLDWGSAH